MKELEAVFKLLSIYDNTNVLTTGLILIFLLYTGTKLKFSYDSNKRIRDLHASVIDTNGSVIILQNEMSYVKDEVSLLKEDVSKIKTDVGEWRFSDKNKKDVYSQTRLHKYKSNEIMLITETLNLWQEDVLKLHSKKANSEELKDCINITVFNSIERILTFYDESGYDSDVVHLLHKINSDLFSNLRQWIKEMTPSLEKHWENEEEVSEILELQKELFKSRWARLVTERIDQEVAMVL